MRAEPLPAPATAEVKPATVVMVHEHYREAGGEDRAFAAEMDLLRSRGHRVISFTADNHAVEAMSGPALARATLWNRDAHRRMAAVVGAERPAVVHCHNTFPLLSPAVYSAARRGGAAVVQTLHNYRLICPNALLFRSGRPCAECVGRRVPWPGILRGCYRGSRVQTAAAGGMVALHRARGTWANDVDAYVALSRFSAGRFRAGGLPADRLFTRPNFLAEDPGAGGHRGGFALYAGRISAEKGIETLLRGWTALGGRVPLKVVGSGPLEGRMQGVPGVEWLGARPHQEVLRLMRDAALLVFPSECYENFPLALAEAFGTGLAVVAGDRGAAGELVREHGAGVVFAPGDAGALAAAVERTLADAGARERMGAAGRAAYERHYTADRAYERLLEIYAAAVARRAAQEKME